jgi:hypothetical protein
MTLVVRGRVALGSPRVASGVMALLVVPLTACLHRGPAPTPGLGPLVSDRPDFTESASVVPTRYVQVESGYTVSRDASVTTQALGEVLARIGLHPRVELRLAPNSYTQERDGRQRVSGFQDVSIGTKLALTPGADAFHLLKPQVALIVGSVVRRVVWIPSRIAARRASAVRQRRLHVEPRGRSPT